MKNNANKRQDGQFFTTINPFSHALFKRWASCAKLPNNCILEPFAGKNNLITYLKEMGLCRHFKSYDITPMATEVDRRNTLFDFPTGFDVCVTNPPWLAKNSATARGLKYPNTYYDDLYKFSLEKCLNNCSYVAALLPESFIRSGLFNGRLWAFISLTSYVFNDTTQPVGLALFRPNDCKDILIYSGNKKIGTLTEIKKHRPVQTGEMEIIFNVPDGNLGLIALDNTKSASIRFCDVNELSNYEVKKHGRHITKLSVSGKIMINKYNNFINEFREKTSDVLMTCYRGLRQDGKYRRRMDWNLARGVIENT